MNIYTGSFDDDNWYTIRLNGEEFDPAPSLAIRSHSPTGFAYGYNGSGPAQLALAILLNETDAETAQRHYMEFKNKVIAGLPQDGSWTLTSEDVAAWLKKQ